MFIGGTSNLFYSVQESTGKGGKWIIGENCCNIFYHSFGGLIILQYFDV
jgi:hypothetical protein